jgi:hypothetical protein
VECYNCETVNGNPGWQKDTDTLERELAAMTAERDALIQTCGELCPHCGWRGLRGDPEQCAFCQNAKLSADLYNMTAAKELAERDRDMLNAKDVSKTREINLLVGENRKLAAELAAKEGVTI